MGGTTQASDVIPSAVIKARVVIMPSESTRSATAISIKLPS